MASHLGPPFRGCHTIRKHFKLYSEVLHLFHSCITPQCVAVSSVQLINMLHISWNFDSKLESFFCTQPWTFDRMISCFCKTYGTHQAKSGPYLSLKPLQNLPIESGTTLSIPTTASTFSFHQSKKLSASFLLLFSVACVVQPWL